MMSEKPIPDYLYHYTSLSSLGLILKNKSLKFNSLKNMDDLEEIKAKDLTEYGKYYFVSCWTDVEEEKLSLWNMYTGDMGGVRIKLHNLPFETYTYCIEVEGVHIKSNNNFLPKEFFEADKYVVYSGNKEIVKRVIYTDDEELLCPQLIQYDSETKINLNVKLPGKYKRKEWNFQDEVRYILPVLPVKVKDANKKNVNELFINNILKKVDLPFEYIFLKVKEEYINEIEITKGPKMSDADSEILDLLVKTYCPDAKIYESKFKGKIRM
ncbi:hypothetical protein Ana3638_11845 [Anaerocolumna sedimenticola]|uniref:DUF2971 domain-containing protein n=1 Tax=Anaerocolumna sedimenticola TaxID=2696063 RepID=A0A6P1TMH6_9FIRM|nr:hypothetical protein [Anaerocolumna sedimenticola]QHQ61379.1 hypothetical protein Ana3638_11845 [Anaerocolumna sedimenticola]